MVGLDMVLYEEKKATRLSGGLISLARLFQRPNSGDHSCSACMTGFVSAVSFIIHHRLLLRHSCQHHLQTNAEFKIRR